MILEHALNLIEEVRTARKVQRAAALGLINHVSSSNLINSTIKTGAATGKKSETTRETLDDLHFDHKGRPYANFTKNKLLGQFQYGDSVYGFNPHSIQKKTKIFGKDSKISSFRYSKHGIDKIGDPYFKSTHIVVSGKNGSLPEANVKHASYIVTPSALKTTETGNKYIDLDRRKELQQAKEKAKSGGPQIVSYNAKYNIDGSQKYNRTLDTAFNHDSKQKLHKYNDDLNNYGLHQQNIDNRVEKMQTGFSNIFKKYGADPSIGIKPMLHANPQMKSEFLKLANEARHIRRDARDAKYKQDLLASRIIED